MTDTRTSIFPETNRSYKSRLFEMIYSEKSELLELYNAIHGTHYDNPEQLEINTLKNAIYMSMHNDVSFIIDSQLQLYEHQSTVNPNLPLRSLMYIADLYSVLTKDENLYGEKQIYLPTPEFITFYNGTDSLPDSEVIKLSDAYTVDNGEPSLELKMTVLNINPGSNQELKKKCKTLDDYAVYTNLVRRYAKDMPLREAVERAISECIENDILAKFLTKNKAEAIKVSIYEYDEEKHMRQEREASWEEGWEEGRLSGIKEGEERGKLSGRRELLKELIQKKLLKKMSVSEIAEELEEDEKLISELIQELE